MIGILESQLKTGKIFHAYLILSNSDHSSVAERLINLFDINPIDRYILKAEETLKISSVREVQQFVKFAPIQSKYKLVIIPQAHNLTLEAQNALLKTLEEPSGHSIILLIAEGKNQLLDTVLSRCQEIRLNDSQLSVDFIQLGVIKEWNLVKRSRWAEEQAKKMSKGEILSLVDNWLLELKEDLAGNSKLSELISRIFKYRKMIKTNANTRLILENIIFNL